jgi:hypothetical protein
MRHFSTVLRCAAIALFAFAVAAVTAGAAVRGSRSTYSSGSWGWGSGSNTSGSNTSGTNTSGSTQTPAAQPASGTPTTPTNTPAQASAPSQSSAQSPTPQPGQGTTPAHGAGTTTETTTSPADPAAAPIPVPPAVAPVIGESMGVQTVAGAVQVRMPGSSGYVPLSAAGSVPSGAVVDARAGTILLRSAVDAAGHTQTARIRGAVFEVRQSAGGAGMTDLYLRGGRPQGCPAPGSAATARAALAHPTARKGAGSKGLWAQDDHGRFRSHGRNSVATVRGTRWVTRETCAGTVTTVMQGAVDVFDRHTKRTVRVRAGHGYLARDSR